MRKSTPLKMGATKNAQTTNTQHGQRKTNNERPSLKAAMRQSKCRHCTAQTTHRHKAMHRQIKKPGKSLKKGHSLPTLTCDITPDFRASYSPQPALVGSSGLFHDGYQLFCPILSWSSDPPHKCPRSWSCALPTVLEKC